MVNLYKNELKKLIAKKASWILLIVALAFEGLIMAAFHVAQKNLTAGNLLASGGPAFGGAFVLIFSIVITAIIVTEEFQKNTIKILLTRPFTRTQVLASKALAAITYMLVSFVAVVIFAVIFAVIAKGGWGDISTYDSAMKGSGLIYMLRNILAQIFVSLFYLVVTFLLAAGMRSQALSITFSIGLYFLLQNMGSVLTGVIVLTKNYWLKWNPLTLILTAQEKILNLDLSKVDNLFGGINTPLWASMLGLLIYIVLIYWLANVIFRKRDISLS